MGVFTAKKKCNLEHEAIRVLQSRKI